MRICDDQIGHKLDVHQITATVGEFVCRLLRHRHSIGAEQQTHGCIVSIGFSNTGPTSSSPPRSTAGSRSRRQSGTCRSNPTRG